ncbi:hypothetical protein AB0L40_26450, partial [Patulibacter sp. NPDC049589]|uniref:hypothetical protein n=1 Tax=Patulibacter sp. NPDC049589 TaxID=3154731 RepID=UPI00344A3EE3
MTSRRPRPAVAALVVVLLLAVAASAVRPAAADAGRRVTTPGFKGSTKRLKAKPTGAAAKPTPPIALAAGARHPHAVVDAAGTAYVTWNVPTDGSEGPRREDAIGFCRLPRGATACDNPPETRLLIPQKTYGTGDDPFLNQEVSRGAAPVIVGDQLVILSTRYPTLYPLPDGDTTDRATIQFVSLDGGTSFSGGSPVTSGINILDVPVSFGSDTSPRIGTLNPTEDGIVFRALSPGAFTGAGAILEPGALYGANTQLTRLPNGGIAALFADGPGSIAVRRFLGQGDPNDVANWTPKEHLQGYDPSIATGSGGRLLVARKEFSDHGVYTVQTLAGPGAATKPVPLHPVGLDAARIQGDGGPLTAAYVDAGGATDSVSGHTGLSVRRSPGGGSAFGAEQRITTTPRDTFEPSFDAAPDGGGFVAWAADDGAPAEIRGHFFGSLAKSSSPGLPTTTPGSATGDGNVTNADCQHRDFGKIRVRTENGCFLSGKRDGHAVAVSEGPIFVNGLKVTPIGKTQLVVDPKTRQ